MQVQVKQSHDKTNSWIYISRSFSTTLHEQHFLVKNSGKILFSHKQNVDENLEGMIKTREKWGKWLLTCFKIINNSEKFMHAETFFVPLSSHPPSAIAICMMESLFHSEKLFQVHILCQRDGGGDVGKKYPKGRRWE